MINLDVNAIENLIMTLQVRDTDVQFLMGKVQVQNVMYSIETLITSYIILRHKYILKHHLPHIQDTSSQLMA